MWLFVLVIERILYNFERERTTTFCKKIGHFLRFNLKNSYSLVYTQNDKVYRVGTDGIVSIGSKYFLGGVKNFGSLPLNKLKVTNLLWLTRFLFIISYSSLPLVVVPSVSYMSLVRDVVFPSFIHRK